MTSIVKRFLRGGGPVAFHILTLFVFAVSQVVYFVASLPICKVRVLFYFIKLPSTTVLIGYACQDRWFLHRDDTRNAHYGPTLHILEGYHSAGRRFAPNGILMRYWLA